MKSTVINTCKELTAYSDFPPNKCLPNYMHNTDLLQYFRDYAQHFDLLKYIRFNTRVVDVRRAEDFEDTGRWIVEARDM
jgi:dimethylaniline monooxygenase (N-oxide forming)